jgi:hypothetical protein
MSTATVHHLPTSPAAKADRLRDLDEQAKDLTVGQWVRVTWRNEDGSHGVVEGKIARPSKIRHSLWVGRTFCLSVHGRVNLDVTAIETEPRPQLDMDTLAERVAFWCDAQLEFENKPVGRTGTGDRTLEENAMLEAEDYVRAYLRAVQV